MLLHTDQTPALPDRGQIAFVRQRRYLVEHVTEAPESGQATLVELSCLDDDAQGEQLAVLWEHELDARVVKDSGWSAVAEKGFDDPPLFAAYLRTLSWNCVTATDPRLFQAPFRAGIRTEIYQLEPLSKALQLPRVNLFIADDVGVGKTIEAGLIARELLLRRRIDKIVVACPPSMLDQWHDEMQLRFGLVFTILDRAHVTRMRRERGFSVNPWMTHSRFLISHRLLIDEAYASGLRDWLGTSRRSRCSSSTRRTMPRRRAARGMRSTRRRPARCATSLLGSNTGCSSPQPRTTGTGTASPRCWRFWTLSDSAEASRCAAESLSG